VTSPTTLSFFFFAVPAHALALSQDFKSVERLTPTLPELPDIVDRALAGAQYRHYQAKDRLRGLLHGDTPPTLGAPNDQYGPSVLLSQPPNDLPALLRLADQLDQLAETEAGERALVWKCNSCGTRYAVPISLVRTVSIRCERCGSAVELAPGLSLGEEALMEPLQGVVNDARKQLAIFFREAMARGWPVLVSAPKAA
jgi:DNA-directed RNA polymerase subunit RPC12/RpoP